MKVNCHIDPNIEEEHLDLFVREMNPQISNLLKSFTSTEPVLWCYDADQINKLVDEGVISKVQGPKNPRVEVIKGE